MPVKRSAILCQDCSLICHSRCEVNAPLYCDLQEQLLAYAKHQSLNGGPPERGRKLSSARRPSVSNLGELGSGPPTAFPYAIMTGWRKVRNSASSVATSEQPTNLSTSVPTPRPTDDSPRSRPQSYAAASDSLRGSDVSSSSRGTARSRPSCPPIVVVILCLPP